MIYLASPFTHKDPEVQAVRARRAANAAADLMMAGEVIYSPIAHGCAIDTFLPRVLSLSHDFWMKQCLAILEKCDALYVLMLDGWDESVGLLLEVERATQKGMRIEFYDPEKLSSDIVNARIASTDGMAKLGYTEKWVWAKV